MRKITLTIALSVAIGGVTAAAADAKKISSCSWAAKSDAGLNADAFKSCLSTTADDVKIYACGIVARLGNYVGSPNFELLNSCLVSPATADTIGVCKQATDNADESRDADAFIACLYSN